VAEAQTPENPRTAGVSGRLRKVLDRRRERSDEEFERRFSSQFAKHW